MNVNVGKIPPLAESLREVNPSKPTSQAWDPAFQVDTIHNAINVVCPIVVDSDGLCNSQPVSFDGEGIRLDQRFEAAETVFVLHPMNIDAFVCVRVVIVSPGISKNTMVMR